MYHNEIGARVAVFFCVDHKKPNKLSSRKMRVLLYAFLQCVLVMVFDVVLLMYCNKSLKFLFYQIKVISYV